MKIYSGNKWRLVWSYGYSLGGGRSWVAVHKIMKPKKGGHTHNHVNNQEEKLIVRK